MQGTSIVKNSVKIFLCIFLLLVLVSGVQAAETYQFVTKWGDSFSTADGQFMYPKGVAVDNLGNVYVAEESGNRVQKFTPDGQFITKWGSNGTGDGQFTMSNLEGAWGIAVDPQGYVYVTDSNLNRVQKFTSSGQFVTKWGSSGTGDGQFRRAKGIAVDSQGNVYVADAGNNRTQKFTSSGQFVTKWGSSGTGNGEFSYPHGITVDKSGNVYVSDLGNSNRIQKFTSDGQFITSWGGSTYYELASNKGGGPSPLNTPIGLATDLSGNVYVSDNQFMRIIKFTPQGQFITTWGKKWNDNDIAHGAFGSGNGEFFYPYGIAVDSGGKVYVADSYNNRIQKFEPVITTITKTTTPTIPVPASLIITSIPTGADIFIDGVQRGTTPHTFTDIALGSHSVIVSKIGYLGKYSTITVSQGQPTTVDVTLELLQPGTGTISVISDPPGAGIMLDGKYSGQATPYDFSGISPGVHTVEMTLVGYNSYTQTVTVVPGTTVVVKKVWNSTPPRYTVVFINSIPDGANVYIDDSYKGVTPTSLHLEKGTYILKLTKKDYVDDESPLYVGLSGPITVTRTLNLPDPGFEGILAIISLIAVVLFVRRFR